MTITNPAARDNAAPAARDNAAALSDVTRHDSREALLTARYRLGDSPGGQHWNETMALLTAHRTVRHYKPDPLPEGMLETLVLAAQSAATSSNLQTWSVVAVSDPDKKAILAEVTGGQKHILQAPVTLVWVADLSRLKAIAVAKGETAEGLDYLEMGIVGIVDAALAAQNAVIAAESLGLGTVYIGAMRNDPERVAKLLDLPPMAFAVFGLCVGYPVETVVTGVKPRLPQRVVLHREAYSGPADPADIAAYDEAMFGFQRDQAMKPSAWSGQSTARVAGPQSLSGRDKLRQVLERLGFRLR